MKKAEREAYIVQKARDMADSGEYANFRQIETKLRFSGFPEARRVLDDGFIRSELNASCKGKSIYNA